MSDHPLSFIGDYLPRHNCSLTIEHNPHKDNYETAKQYIESPYSPPEFESQEEKQRCIKANDFWQIRWYPDTPIANFCIAAQTLQGALAYARQIQEQADKENAQWKDRRAE